MFSQWAKDNPIFVSSTYKDLKGYRSKVLKNLRKSKFMPENMEDFCATDNTTVDECVQRVKNSKIYVGILGHKYGTVDPKTGKSYTELEYEAAEKHGLKKLIFVICDYNETEKVEEKQSSFIKKIKETSDKFTSPDDLAANVSAALHFLRSEHEQLQQQQIVESKNECELKDEEITELKNDNTLLFAGIIIAVVICVFLCCALLPKSFGGSKSK
ncbi:MAG: DUF4062 domain-containing protein [Nitrososphaerota archaeon]|jgi:hypothetical protein|nr:DUF4062 domain-containing protein [Nitrososphaerota archaeon]